MLQLRNSRCATYRGGFTLIELAVVMTILAIFAALVAPAVIVARRNARQAQCANHLRQVGMILHDQMNRSMGRKKFCSGAIHPAYDGDPSEFGWIADLKRNDAPRELLFCPSNPATKTESLSLSTLRQAYDRGLLPKSVTANDDGTLAAFQAQVVDFGYNTNYCQIWVMARSDLLPPAQRRGTDPNDTLDPKNSIGPLAVEDASLLDSGALMLLADGMPILEQNREFAKTITTGPVDPNDLRSKHDFSAVGLVHGRNRSANVLFADGHVAEVEDKNGNGVLDAADLEGQAIVTGIRAARLPPAP